MPTPVPAYLDRILDLVRDDDSGEVADYIDELAAADPDKLGVALCTTSGNLYSAGDDEYEFTIQSISKPFVYALALEELGAAGCPLLMMVVSPAICGTIIARSGTPEQRDRWLPGIADGSLTMAFAITEPDAGSNSHEITTVARRDGDEWVLKGQKVWISGVDVADAVLVVAKLADSQGVPAPAPATTASEPVASAVSGGCP